MDWATGVVVDVVVGCPVVTTGWTNRYTVGVEIVVPAVGGATSRTTCAAAGEAGGKELIVGAGGFTDAFRGVSVGMEGAIGVAGAANGVAGGLLVVGRRPAA